MGIGEQTILDGARVEEAVVRGGALRSDGMASA